MNYEGKAASAEPSSLALPLRSRLEYFPGTQRRKWVWTSVDCCSSLRGHLAALGHLGQQHTWARCCVLPWSLQLPWHLTPAVDFIPWSSSFLMSQAELPLTKDAMSLGPAIHAVFLRLTPTCITRSHLPTSWPGCARVQLLYEFRMLLLQIQKSLSSSESWDTIPCCIRLCLLLCSSLGSTFLVEGLCSQPCSPFGVKMTTAVPGITFWKSKGVISSSWLGRKWESLSQRCPSP